ncbi:uncharacterized protein Nmlp_3078 [Natronomonas moolapensis 8.8.11]|uniref:HTH domain protein n=2 Tax=Halobacteriales TaxID=2235 RepID=M1XS97_NATM8|nr:DUF5821 family protein [Natronomonas moolapensis]CCQ37220.1 uncharacterized protein Nmlp_3078 [Natronomonas moolapensis 8.8.11]
MKQTVVEPTVAGVLGGVFDVTDGGVVVVAPDPETIEGLVRVLAEGSPSVRLLADVGALKAATSDFLVAGQAANHVENGGLEIRRYDDGTNALVVSESSVTAVVRGDDCAAGLTTDDRTFVADANGRFADAWADAEAYDLRTPPLAEVRDTLETELGESTAADFDAVLSALDSVRDGTGLDEVTVSLLVAARNGDLLYDISRWGEDVGIASKATFSRTKTRMEESGVIETEKVPIDVGRPRLRLRLGDERLDVDDESEFARVARSLLAE